MDIKKKILIKGQIVHDVGYRPFLLGIAESMEIERFFAKNIFMDEKQVVHALVDSSEEKVKAFIDIVSSEYPEKSEVETVEVEDFIGNVTRIESYYRYLTAMQLSKIATYGGKMLDKQDESLKVLNNINKDTSDIKSTIKTIDMDIRDARFSLSHMIETKFKGHDADIAQIKITLGKVQEAIKAT